MKLAYCSLLLMSSWIVFPARADSLNDIATFAEKICNQSLVGNESSTTIQANLNGDLNGLAKALGISVGAGGLVKKDGSHYDGIPKDKLPNAIPTPAQCKLELAKVLISERERLAAAPNTGSSVGTVTNTGQNGAAVGVNNGSVNTNAAQSPSK